MLKISLVKQITNASIALSAAIGCRLVGGIIVWNLIENVSNKRVYRIRQYFPTMLNIIGITGGVITYKLLT